MIKEKDVYKIRYTEKAKTSTESLWGDLNHCFEGVGVVVNRNNNLIIADTFWGIGTTKGRVFNKDDIDNKINIELIGNLEDYERIDSVYIDYYDDKDLMRLSRQHGCASSCVEYYKKKGAIKSKQKIKRIIKEKIADAEMLVRFKRDEIERLKALIEKINIEGVEGIYI